jgi:hypothetical protein
MAANGRREKVALYLASGLTIRKAARKSGAGERSVYRWLTEDAFRHRVAELRTRLLERAVGRLAHGASKAGLILYRLRGSDEERTRLAAARAILDAAIKVREAWEVQERLEALEKLMAEQGDRNRRNGR